ncbi:MAG TPA: TetR/AcrR family transcriptional regulator [Chloroflexia bacterium]|nr:TetR/AcrR family transcriptional regulator [Chloroflexia bacterium]
MARPVDPQKRVDILTAARKLFYEKGFNQTPMSQIAQEAGIANGTIYLYFSSKEALALALSEDFFARLKALVLPSVTTASNPDAIMNVVRATLDFIKEERDLVAILNMPCSFTQTPDSMPERREFYQQLSQVFEAKIEQGIIRSYNPQVVAELVAGLIEWVAESTLVRGFGKLERYEETLVAFIQNALFTQ